MALNPGTTKTYRVIKADNAVDINYRASGTEMRLWTNVRMTNGETFQHDDTRILIRGEEGTAPKSALLTAIALGWIEEVV